MVGWYEIVQTTGQNSVGRVWEVWVSISFGCGSGVWLVGGGSSHRRSDGQTCECDSNNQPYTMPESHRIEWDTGF